MRTADVLRRAVALAFLAGACLLAGAPAIRAQEPRYERAPRKAKTVTVATFRNYVVGPPDLFREAGDALPYDVALRDAYAYIEDRLAARPDVEFVSARELRDRITSRPTYRDGVRLAGEWFNLGVDHYRALRVDASVETFDRAEALYLEVFQDFVDTAALSELELYRGLALGEKGAGYRGHVAFRRLFVFNPWQRFPRGYHPAATEEALRGALVDFQQSANRDLPFFEPERIDRFLAQQGLDTLLYAYLEPASPDGGPDADAAVARPPVLHLVAYERAPGRLSYRDSAPLSGGPEDRDTVDRLLNRWLSCAEWAPRTPPRSSQDTEIFIDAGAAYTIILDQPPREYSHDFGFHAAFAYQFSRRIDLHAAIGIQTTFPDSKKDLRHTSTHFRFVFGPGFTFRSPHLRFYVHPGVVIHYLGDYIWTTNPNCKFYYGLPAEEQHGCEEGVDRLDTNYFIGVDLAAGLNIFLTSDIYVDVRVDGEAWFLPYDPTGVLAFPITFALSMGYAI